jgi:hypothetical protein
MNNACGITIGRDINGAKNIYMLLTNMFQKNGRVTRSIWVKNIPCNMIIALTILVK